jgi:hypothetical protein
VKLLAIALAALLLRVMFLEAWMYALAMLANALALAVAANGFPRGQARSFRLAVSAAVLVVFTTLILISYVSPQEWQWTFFWIDTISAWLLLLISGGAAPGVWLRRSRPCARYGRQALV